MSAGLYNLSFFLFLEFFFPQIKCFCLLLFSPLILSAPCSAPSAWLTWAFYNHHESCMSSLLKWLIFFPLVFRGASQEKDKPVSSSIVSSVQSKITQVLFFFFSQMVSAELYGLCLKCTECCSLFPSRNERGHKVLCFNSQVYGFCLGRGCYDTSFYYVRMYIPLLHSVLVLASQSGNIWL